MKLLRNLSITLKLTLVFILFATLVLLGLSVPAYLNARYSLRSAAVSELLATSLEKEAALNAWVENRQHNILDIANQPHLQEIMRDYLNLSAGSPAARLLAEEITRNLQNWTGEGHLFKSMQILEADSGRILLSTNPADVGKFREQEAFFIKGRDGSVIENPVYDLSSASYVMMGAAPIVASDGSLLAVLAGSLDLKDMDTIIQRRTGLHQMDDTFLVNTSHLFVTQPRLQTDATVVQHGIDTIAVNTCLERNSGVYEGNDYRGIPAIVVYRWMGERNMCLIVKIDQQEAYSAARALSMTFLLVGGLVLLAGSLASIAIARSMSQPLHDLLEETIQLGQGNLERRIQVRSSDEIGKVGQAFNLMAGSLQAQEIQLREWSGELEQKVEQRTLELSDSEERYRNILETIEDGYYEIDLKGTFTFFNPALPKIYRYDPHELMGMNFRQYMDTENAVSVYQVFNQVYRTGLPADGIEWEVICKDGEKLFVESSASPIKDSEGTITGFRGIVRDVTQRKQASDLLLESEANYRSLFDNMPVGVYRSSPDGSILAANKALVTMMGYDTEAELMNNYAYQMYETQDDRNQYLKEIDEYGFVKNLEVHMRTKQGEPIVGLENARAYYAENGKVLYYEGSLTDITGRKQVDLERQILLEIMQGLTVTDDLHDYLEIVHHAIGKVITAKNFFVALNNKATGMFDLAYLVDEFDQQISSYDMGKTLSAYVYRSAKPYLFDPQSFDDLCQQGLVELVGAYSPSWLGVPLIVSNETIGVMGVQDYENENRYTQHDVDILTSISGGVAQAIRRKSAEAELAQLFETEQRRSLRLSDLQILGTELTSLHSEQEVLERLVNKAALLSNSPVCTVMLLDSNTEEIVLAAHFGLPTGVPTGLRIPMALLPEAARAFRSGKTIIISNIDQEMPAMRKVLVHPGVQSFFAFPLLLDGVVTGAITLSSMQPRHPSEAEIKTYELLARLVSAALENVRLFEGVNRSLQRMGSLRRVDMAISASFDLVMTLNILLEQITTHLGVDAADILVLDATDATLKYTCGRGFRSQALRYTNLRVGEGFAGQAAMESRTIHVADLQKEMHALEKSSSLPSEGFVSYWGVPLLAKGSVRGVLEVFNRQPISVDKDWINFMETLAGQAAIAIDNVQLFNHLERSNADLAMAYDSTLTGWATALELRDNETEGHTRRVAITTTLLAGRMGVRDEEIRFIRWGALLHDIGKMGIPDSILLKPGPLSDEEWVTMRTHPNLAYEMLSPINYLSSALDIPYCHHEKWDGSGYPRGLKGVQIPLAARIFAIVDVWDALTSDRPYRSAWTPEKTMKYIQEQVDTHFDPQVAKAFFEMIGPDGKLPGE